MALTRNDIPSNSRFLNSQDVKTAGGSITGTVSHVVLEAIQGRDGGKPKQKVVFYLENNKPFIAGADNLTRCFDALAGQTEDLEDIVGGRVKLGLHKVRNPNGPGLVDGIPLLAGVRLAPSGSGSSQTIQSQPEANPQTRPVQSRRDDLDDEIPF
jgi:hypothetical protein